MSSSNHIGNRPRIPITAAIGAGALILGIPIAVAALKFEQVYVPDVVLGSKEIKAGLDTSKTINFTLLTGINDAVISGSYISIISSILFVVGLVVVRHFSQHNIFGWAMVFPAAVDFLGNVAVLAYVFIVNGQHPEAKSADEVRFENGQYETDGKLYTRDAWACMMEKFYNNQEGSWAPKACSDLVSSLLFLFLTSLLRYGLEILVCILRRDQSLTCACAQKTGRLMTIPLVITSMLLLALALWQVQRRGGLGWLFGRRAKIAAMSQSKGEFIDMQTR